MASLSPKEDYFEHLFERLGEDEAALEIRDKYWRVLNNWLDEAIRLNGGEFAWEPRHQWNTNA